MVELAIEGNPRFEVSTIEIERPGPTYTVDTLTELRRRMGDADLYLILGMDSVRELGRWHRPERIFELCSVAAVSRPGVADVSLHYLERVFPSSAGKVRMVGGPMVKTSATDIRLRAAGDATLQGIPDSVRGYILKHALYNNG